ncbi:MAG: ATP-binding protein [Candidatus Micrarchaeia archaeon]
MTLLEEALSDSNPWWKGAFFPITYKPREEYKKIEPFITKKQIIGIYGLRRTGKSYLLYHIIKRLLEDKKDPKIMVYFSFDAFRNTTLSEVLKESTNITGKEPKFLFLDEVQKIENWQEQVKRIYDLKNIKIFVTGSESLFLKKTSKESLAGRIFEFEMKPLSFREYLGFKGIKITKIYSEEIKKALNHYLLTGGFPELVEETDSFFIRKYIKEGIIDKAIFREIPETFSIDDPSFLEKIMNILVDNPGLLLDKNDLANTLGIYRKTVTKYLFYLESSFLIRNTYNYSTNVSTSEKKLKKYYPGFSCLGIGAKSDSAYVGKVVESVCVNHLNAKFFWRNPQKDEIDIILTEPLLPIEVKYQENPEIGGMKKFQERFNARKGLVITKNTDKKEKGIEFIPLWKWLLG